MVDRTVPLRTMTPFERKRLAAGLTQQQVADKLGVSQPAVKKWDNGGKPSPRYYPKIAKLLKLSTDDVVSLFASPSVTAKP